MKKYGNILKYPVILGVFFALLLVLDKLFGNAVEGRFRAYLIQAVAFLLALLLSDIAQKKGWDTWSGLVAPSLGLLESCLVA